MNITKLPFGRTEKGEAVDLYTLKNNSGVSVKITNYGGIITDIVIPDKNDQLDNVNGGCMDLVSKHNISLILQTNQRFHQPF